MEEEQAITVSLPSGVIEELDKMAKEGNTTRDQLLRAAIDQYFESSRIWEQIFKWGEEAARELGIKDKKDVDRLIHE
jgi:metal-responsive CopG/Arc/MetJ family transcriptional regulator